MPAPALKPELWEALKLASMRGCPDDELSRTFGVACGTIRQRRHTDPQWKAVVNNPPGVPPHKRGLTKRMTLDQKAGEIATAAGQAIALSMETIASESPLMVARFAHESIGRSIEGKVIPDPSNWKELATAANLIRSAARLDKAETAVTLNLWSGQPAAQMMRDCGPVESQEA